MVVQTATLDHRHDDAAMTCDLLILGAGPALAAAQAAVGSGLSIVLVDDNPLPGGQIWRTGPGFPSEAQARSTLLAQHRNLQLHTGTRCVAVHGPQQLLLENAQGPGCRPTRSSLSAAVHASCCCPFRLDAAGRHRCREPASPHQGRRAGGGTTRGRGRQRPLLLAVAHTARGASAQVLRVAEQALPVPCLTLTAGLWRWPGKLVPGRWFGHCRLPPRTAR